MAETDKLRSDLKLPSSLVLIGAGKMGTAMLEGWLALGLAPERVVAVDPRHDDETVAYFAGLKVSLVSSTAELPPAEVVVLGIKPQALDEVAPSLEPVLGANSLLISILAGKTIADLTARCPAAKAVVRAMPNTPAAVRRGITAAVPNEAVTARQKVVADTLLSGIGKVEWLDDEGLIDAVTAVSGSGPAYVFHLVEAMAQAGAKAGLPADLALRLARATVEGAGELLHRSDLSAETLRKNVTSPGGTTAAALAVLMDEKTGLPPLMEKAVAAAKKRAQELAG